MKAIIFIEGGGSGPDTKRDQSRCREAFTVLLEKAGFGGHMPRLFACGSRRDVFNDFESELKRPTASYVAMWIDSEYPLKTLEDAWGHLKARDQLDRPSGARDNQVLFMTTCMETLIVADRNALQEHYRYLQESALPPLVDLENRDRHDVQAKLAHATRDCSNAYAKGKRSFDVLAKLNPETLEKHLPSFARTRRILNEKLG